MALLTLGAGERMVEYDCVDLLPDLEEDVYFEDTAVIGIEDAYTSAIDEWWPGFVSDLYL